MKTSKDEQHPQQAYGDPKDFLLAVMNDQELQRRYMQLEAFEAVSDNPRAKLSAVIN